LKKYSWILTIPFLSLLFTCANSEQDLNEELDAQYFRNALGHLTDVIVHDIFSPPVASRIYAYSSIASHEAAVSINGGVSVAEQLNEYGSFSLQEDLEHSHPDLSAVYAFLLTGKSLVFSEDKIDTELGSLNSSFRALGYSSTQIDQSREHAEQISKHILAWAAEDHYAETRSAEKYTVRQQQARWIPTPPTYMEAIEPAWREIRPFVLDSAQQFKPPFPSDYDMQEGSSFYEETMEVYHAVRDAQPEEQEIAMFWDCNPYAVQVRGHVMTATKKITPGGHWMEISNIASEMEQLTVQESSRNAALVAICLADAFISCWDEKYRSNLIRPETVINEHIDESWRPLLQTPPFPEYTSGHSVISSAAAVCLTDIYGLNFAFADDSEVKYGLPVRHFESFKAASEEAAISRLYGGIHYRPAIDNGVLQGTRLGEHIMEKLSY
jgi:hypothetical protein